MDYLHYVEILKNYKKDLIEKIKEEVSEVRKNEENLDKFLLREERRLFDMIICHLEMKVIINLKKMEYV